MKTAISIPDALFQEAEDLARRLGISRSQFFAKAATAYVKAHAREDVIAQLDEVYAKQSSQADPVLTRIQAASFPRDDW
jgi:metal-responsive CopG/Arc/MetJ family transcriptional regulator